MILTDILSGTEPPLSAVGVAQSVYLQVQTDGSIVAWTKHGGTWTISGSVSGVNNRGTPTEDQIAVWTDATHIRGLSQISVGGDTLKSNLIIGEDAAPLLDPSADTNVGIGKACLAQLTTGSGNVAIGTLAGDTSVTGDRNVSIGNGAAQASGGIASDSVAIGSAASTGDFSVALGANASAYGTNVIVIGYNITDLVNNTAVIGNADMTDVSFGSVTGLAILHGKGNAIVFPDSDPHVVGAGYWSGGVLTRSNG